MHSFIEEMRDRILRLDAGRVNCEDRSLRFIPTSATGFAVQLTIRSSKRGDTYEVGFEGASEEFGQSHVAARRQIAFGLSRHCRL